MTDFRLGELFCGPGGIALGAKMASETCNPTEHRITHAWATDYDKDTCETYRTNICPESKHSVVHRDIRKEGLEAKLEKISKIDALAFGFPCDDFSIVGEQKELTAFSVLTRSRKCTTQSRASGKMNLAVRFNARKP